MAGLGAIVYLGLNALCAAAYWIGGMSLFDAVCHAMATVATGGFSTHDSNFGFWHSSLLDGINARLDESHDTSRYLIGLLVFLGHSELATVGLLLMLSVLAGWPPVRHRFPPRSCRKIPARRERWPRSASRHPTRLPSRSGCKSETPPGSCAAMARTNGKCQTTSPMPCLTWMTAVEVTALMEDRAKVEIEVTAVLP